MRILGLFFGIFGVFCWGSRISARGVFFQYFLWKFRVGPCRGSVAGRGVLKVRGGKMILIFCRKRAPMASQTAMGAFFLLEDSQTESQSLAIFHRKEKAQGCLGGGG